MVGYLELPGAGHGYDLIDGERAGAMAHATSLFLNQVYRTKTNRPKRLSELPPLSMVAFMGKGQR